jgi:hypothetical protein
MNRGIKMSDKERIDLLRFALDEAREQIVRDGECIPEDADDKSYRATKLQIIDKAIADAGAA